MKYASIGMSIVINARVSGFECVEAHYSLIYGMRKGYG